MLVVVDVEEVEVGLPAAVCTIGDWTLSEVG
jgi:hypothetical protein